MTGLATIARTIGEAGAHLIAHYGNDRAGAIETTASIDAERLKIIGADLKDAKAVDRLWQESLDWRGRIDVVINNAAVMRLSGGIEDESDTWDAVWDEATSGDATVLKSYAAFRAYLLQCEDAWDIGGVLCIPDRPAGAAGRLVVDEPTDLPEGTEIELLPLDPGDWLDEADRAALHKALRDSEEDVNAGRLVDADVVLRSGLS